VNINNALGRYHFFGTVTEFLDAIFVFVHRLHLCNVTEFYPMEPTKSRSWPTKTESGLGSRARDFRRSVRIQEMARSCTMMSLLELSIH
jgi:hypothetical protein